MRQKIKALKLHRRKPVRILGIVAVFLLLPCIFKIMQPNRMIECGEEYLFAEGIPVENTVIYSNIALKPGVYRMELFYDAVYDGAEPVGYSTALDGTVITGGLRTNGEHLYGGLDRTCYDMWLYEGTEHLQLTVSYTGQGGFLVKGYRITETDQLWGMFITMILFGTALGIGVITFFYYDREYAIAEKKKKTFFWLMLIGLLASVPYLYRGNISGIDITYHMMRIEGVKDGLLGGQFPVRIEPKWVFGHGFAAAVFYCNSLLYFPAVLRLLGFPVSTAYNVYCVVITVATAWIAYACFCKIFRDADIGIVCSALYTLSTFRIYKLVNTCAIGEASAVTFMPLVLCGMYRVFTEDPKDKRYRTAWIPIAVGYAGLIQTHVLTCEITAFLTLLICLVCIRKILCLETFLELAKGALAALGISFWFLVPFLDYFMTQNVHIKNLSARTIQNTGLTLAHLIFHFWGDGEYTPNGVTGVYHTYPVGVGFVLVLGLGAVIALWYGGALRDTEKGIAQLTKISVFFSLLLLFMSTRLFPWDRISAMSSLTASLVSSLEFTHRVLGWGTLFLVAVCGCCLWYLRRKNRGYYRAAVLIAGVSVVTSTLYLMDFTVQSGNVLTIYNEEGMGFGFVSDGEYLLEGTDVNRLTFRESAIEGFGVAVNEYRKNYLQVKMNCQNTGVEESYVEVPILYYKGYRAKDCASGSKLSVCAGANNVIRVLLPAGFSGDVEVSFVSPWYWRVSEAVSLLTVAFFLFLYVRRGRTHIC